MTKLEEVQEITRAEFAKLQAQFPGTFVHGGCLLLGRQYAHPASQVLMLGINPGAGPSHELDVGRQEQDWLLDRPKRGYQTFARNFFHSSPALLNVVRLATFSFCSPFRTAKWSKLPKHLKAALIDSSRPILSQVVRDCQPTLIIVAGVGGFSFLKRSLDREMNLVDLISSSATTGVYQWSAYNATIQLRTIVIAQVPHFSWARSRPRLAACAEWLAPIATAAVNASPPDQAK